MSNFGKPASPPHLQGWIFLGKAGRKYMTVLLLLCSSMDSSQDWKFCKYFHLVFKSCCGCSSPIQTEGLLTACCVDFDFFCGGCALGCQCSLGSYFKTGHKGGQGAPVLSPKALPFPPAQAPPPAMGIFAVRMLLVNIQSMRFEPKHIRFQTERLFLLKLSVSQSTASPGA